MEWKSAVARAKRGLREELRLYVIAVVSLAVAFLFVAGVLLAVSNLDALADRWGQTGRMSLFLRDGAEPADIAELRLVLESLPEVAQVTHLTRDQARALFLEQAEVSSGLESLPADAFPASLEVDLKPGTSSERAREIAARVGTVRAVEEVETYQAWFAQLEGLLRAGRSVSLVMVLLVALCVLAVVSNTIRLAVARRKDEIEVLKLCGATDSFVRNPFVIEGSFQGFMAAAVALMILGGIWLAIRDGLQGSLAALTGAEVQFLSGWVLLAMLLGGAVVGAMGSALSVRRYLGV